jgi:penicillin-binding protein A
VNVPIQRLFIAVLILFALLVVFTSRWSVFEAERLQADSENKRPLLEQQRIARGEIRSSDGELLAVSRGRGRGENKRFVRRYPAGALFGHPVGYDFIDEGRTGIEASENDVLVGENNEFATIIEQLTGSVDEGSDLTTTLDAGAQRVAVDQLGGRPGAVVALDPRNGAVKAMASVPGFDPNTIPEQISELSQQEGSPMLNRPTQAAAAPGSTFKVVTAAAALDSGEYDTGTVLNANSPQDFSGVPLANAGGQSFGDIDMTEALTNSVNTYWAQIGEGLGAGTMVDYMERFGFYEDPPLDYPDGQLAPSGVFNARGRPIDEGFDVGRVAIGQGGAEGELRTTPLQMAMVAATIGNGGVMMEPTFVEQVVDPDGRKSDEIGDGDEVRRVIDEDAAESVAGMMTNVTEDGTASSLSVAGGSFAGKTGTAEKDIEASINQVWFIGFAPADDPEIAVAATVERCTGCFGGDTAGPIATAVIDELLGG